MNNTDNSIKYFNNDRYEMKKYIPDAAKRILEVGCSDGNFCKSLKNSEREIWGVELNSLAAQSAGKICHKVIQGDFDEVYKDLPPNYFDCIIFNDVLEHLIAPWNTLDKAKNLLSKNGVVVSSIPNFRFIGNLITEIIIKRDFRYRPEGGILDITHYRFFTEKSILRMYQEQGYEIITHEGINPASNWKINLLIGLTFGFLNDSRFLNFATVAKLNS